MQKKRIGIFSGSFNPIHCGHLILANYICEFTELDEIWFVISPRNPLKERGSLLEEATRLEMVRLALEEFECMMASDIEFKMPRPSYTIHTLTKLERENPDKEFTLIIGADNWTQFHRWKDSEQLITRFPIFIYPRLGEPVVIPERLHASVRLLSAPIMEISSTFIRESIREGKNMRAFLPPKVYDFILQKRIYS